MKETRLIMGMPITVEIIDAAVGAADAEAVFAYFRSVDERFSTYKDTSEISRMNRHELAVQESSADMQAVLALCRDTTNATDGYFDITCADGTLDPSGLVKGWSIRNAALLLRSRGVQNFFIDAGGDIQPWGVGPGGRGWTVGIRNPFNGSQIIKVIYPGNCGVATSGTYIRGQHIYNPKARGEQITDIVSLTVVGPDVYEADRFATAAFAMGKAGIAFIGTLDGCEGYMIDAQGTATYTAGFARYTNSYA